MAVTSAQVQELYVGLLGRAADKAGLDYWLGQLNATGSTLTLENLRANFVNEQAEYAATYGNLARADLVKAIYTNLFERTPTTEEVNYWANGTVNADQMIVAFLNGASVADQAVVSNKVVVAEYYTAAAGADFNQSAAAAIIADVNGTAASVSTALNGLPVSNATFNAAVVKLVAADKAVDANIKAWGVAHSDATPTAAEIYGALATAEAKVATAALDPDLGISSGTQTALNSVEAATYTDYNSADAAEALALSIARSEIATKKLALDGALTSAVNGLEAVSSSDKAGSLKALVDGYQAKVLAAQAAQTTENAAALALTGKVAEAEVVLDSAFDVTGADAKDYSFSVSATGGVVVFNGNGATDQFGNYQATYDASTDKWTYAKYDPLADAGNGAYVNFASDSAVSADVNLQKLLTNATSKSVLDAAAASAEATAASNAADASVATELAKIEAVDATLTDGAVLTGVALTYQNAVKDLADHAEAKTAFDQAVSGVEAVRADAAALAALQKAAADAYTAVDAVADIVAIGSAATAGNDLFIFDGKTGGTTANFGVDGTDKIFFGTGYSLVTLADNQVIADNVGSSSALEIFYDASEATLYVEAQTFGGNSAGTNDVVSIVLTGVTGGVALSADGYLTVA